jgi:hypothetical protein
VWYTSLQLLELSVVVEDCFCDAWFACPSPPYKLVVLYSIWYLLTADSFLVKLSLDGFWWLVVFPVLSVLGVLDELTTAAVDG